MTNEQLCAPVNAIARHRDRSAFTELFTYFAPKLKGFGMRRGVDAAAAEELAQETMLTVWRKADTFDPAKASVPTWVFTIVRNKRIDMFRREGFPEADLSEVAESASEDASADDLVSAAQSGAAIQAAMKELPPEQMRILHAAFYEDKSHRQLAEELQLPLGTMKSRIRLALARLRSAMSEA